MYTQTYRSALELTSLENVRLKIDQSIEHVENVSLYCC